MLDISFVERHTALDLTPLHPLLGRLQQFWSDIEGGDAPVRPHCAGQQSRETARARACLQGRRTRADAQPVDDLLIHLSVKSVGANQIRWVVSAVPVPVSAMAVAAVAFVALLMLVLRCGHILILPYRPWF